MAEGVNQVMGLASCAIVSILRRSSPSKEFAMQCQEIMKDSVECLSPNDTVQSAATKMRDRNIGFMPICDQSKKVIGTITDRDIAIRLVASNRPASAQVADYMSKEVVACRPTDDVQMAADMMGRHHKSRMLCTDSGGRLLGVISLSDIAQQGDDLQAATTMRQVTTREARLH
jgi:CBS domain-containing protein